MAAINAPRLVVTSERPTTTGSWDDLISRNRGRSRNSMMMLSENEERRRAQGENRVHGSLNETGSARGTNGGASSPAPVPVAGPRRMLVHHPDQRTSMAFATHVSSLNGRPSPLSTSVSSDSFPGFDADPNPNPSTSFQAAEKPDNYSLPNTHYSPRPSMYGRVAHRLSDGPRMAEPQQSYDSVPVSRNRMRTISWSGMPPGHDSPALYSSHQQRSLPNRNTDAGWQRRPELIKHFRIPRSKPNEVFNNLPTEVLGLILDCLKALHMEQPSNGGCSTCWMRNCCAIAMGNKKLLQVAKVALYEHIQLIGPDNPAQRKKFKNMHSTRLVLLRRSLRGDRKLAELVRSIKVPALMDDAGVDGREYHDTVASVIMACPNLERLDGFYPIYDHGNSRLFNALGSRASLKEMTWVVDAPPSDAEPQESRFRSQSRSRRSQSRGRTSKSRSSSVAAPSTTGRHTNSRGYLVPELANKFVLHHMYWKELTSLTIHCLPGATLSTPNDLIAVILTYLPSIKTLCLSNIPARSFDDDTLLTISSRLTKLSLTRCPGVTTSGLAAYASGLAVDTLEILTLVHQDLDSLASIVRMLSKLSKLDQLNVVQSLAPRLPNDTLVWLMPYMVSPSLKALHWDIFESWSSSTEADTILARSIMAHGFPSLHKLCVPHDPSGMFQALCRPTERIDLPGDRYLNLIMGQSNGSPVRPPTAGRSSARAHTTKPSSSTNSYSGDTADGRSSSETGDSGKGFIATREAGSDLHQARLAAQARLEAARRFPRFEVNVTDEVGLLVESAGLAGFLGDVTSKITYCLTPEIGATDEHGGLVGMAELLGDRGEDLSLKGDAASRSGAGYGTGCVAQAFSRAQTLALVETTTKHPTVNKLTKQQGGGGGLGLRRNKAQQALDSIETAPKTKKGCTGITAQANGGKNHDADVNWHTERGRWRGRVVLT